MASDTSDRATGFAEAACKLLIEYTARLAAQKQEATKMLDRINDHRSSVDSDHMRRRFRDEMNDFSEARETYERLIRKASQLGCVSMGRAWQIAQARAGARTRSPARRL